MDQHTDPPLSLVVATVQGWPGYAPMFRTHLAAVRAVGGELLVADGSGRPAPGPEETGPEVTWISQPGEGVFELRRHAYARATGAILAITEDHCALPPDWGPNVLEVHAEQPDAAIIGGAVENGARDTDLDWALFYVSHFRDMPSVGRAVRVPFAGITIATYKGWVTAELARLEALGMNEAGHQRRLAAQGHVLLMDDRIRVTHVQSASWRRALSITWHATRSSGATRRRHPGVGGILRFLASPVLPFVFLGLMVREGRRRRYEPDWFRSSLPASFALLCVRTAGDAVGFAFGPGDSRNRFP